jgi:Icc-related predicted phosphoesterase
MRIQLISDIHRDINARHGVPLPTLRPDADVLIVAGDHCQGAIDSLDLSDKIRSDRDIHVVQVFGNHEFYGKRFFEDEWRAGKTHAFLLGIHLLEASAVVIEGVTFVGGTLWSDFGLFGPLHVPAAERVAHSGLNDFQGQILQRGVPGRWTTARSKSEFAGTASAIEDVLEKTSGTVVVVTHNAPHPGSIMRGQERDLLSAAFANDMSDMIETYNPVAWVHGHVHQSSDILISKESDLALRRASR